MKRKGFTLIELLAVIVILAIIAVIATPIIVGIIEDSRKASFERSVEGIIHATDLDFGTQETLLNNTYTITDGVVNTTLKTPIKNIEGFSGKIKYDEKGNSTYAIHNDKWCMKKTSEGNILTEEYVDGECEIPNPYANGTPIYFDVVNGEGCREEDYHEDNSKTGYNGTTSTKTTTNQTSCLKFYAFNYTEGDTKINLLLDHNTTEGTYWTNSSTGSNANGPIQALTELQNATSTWLGTETPSDYEVGKYIIPYTSNNYKARLIEANEIAEITGNTSFDESTAVYNSNYFYFDTNTTSEATDCKSGDTSGCSYGWLYDRTATNCEEYGCLNNSDSLGSSYWTATSAFGSTNRAWLVSSNARLVFFEVHYQIGGKAPYGVRPVIEVLVSNL